jgi:hypothetical protein
MPLALALSPLAILAVVSPCAAFGFGAQATGAQASDPKAAAPAKGAPAPAKQQPQPQQQQLQSQQQPAMPVSTEQALLPDPLDTIDSQRC